MSIISEALKKAQDTSVKFKIPHSKVSRGKIPHEGTKRSKSHAYSIIVVCVFLLFSVVVFFFFSQPTPIPSVDSKNFTIEPAKDTPHAAQASVKKEEIMAPAQRVKLVPQDIKSRMDLNGIMYTPGRPLVVINDNIWAEGDTVSGFQILKIEENSVKVSSNGQEFIIRLKR